MKTITRLGIYVLLLLSILTHAYALVWNTSYTKVYQINYTCQNPDGCKNEFVAINLTGSLCGNETVMVRDDAYVVPFRLNNASRLIYTMLNGTYNTPVYNYSLYCEPGLSNSLSRPEVAYIYESCTGNESWQLKTPGGAVSLLSVSNTSINRSGYGNVCHNIVGAGQDYNWMYKPMTSPPIQAPTRFYFTFFYYPIESGNAGWINMVSLNSQLADEGNYISTKSGQFAWYSGGTVNIWPAWDSWHIVKFESNVTKANIYIDGSLRGVDLTTRIDGGHNGTLNKMGMTSGGGRSFFADEIIVSSENVSLYQNKGLVSYSLLNSQSLTFINQTPPDISTSNLMGRSLNITYEVVGYANSSIRLDYFVNSTVGILSRKINGSAFSVAGNISNTSSYGNLHTWLLDDNLIYPGVYDIDPDIFEHATSLPNLTIGSNNVYGQEFYGFSAEPYSLYEFNIDISGAGACVLSLCNSSWNRPDAITNNCVNFCSVDSSIPFNHSHSPSSKHKVCTVGTIGNNIGSVRVTDKMTVLLHGCSANIAYLNNITRKETSMLSANNGNSYTNLSITADMHFHLFPANSTLFYYAHAGTTSDSRYDYIELAGIAPSQPINRGIAPNPVYINHTVLVYINDSISPNGYPIALYHAQLWSLNYTYMGIHAYSNTSPVNMSSGAIPGEYYVKSFATDSLNQNSTSDYSALFVSSYCAYSCSHYERCAINNRSSCTALTEANGCLFDYSGAISDFDSNCTYQSLSSTTAVGDLSAPAGVMLLFVLVFGWIVLLLAGLVFKIRAVSVIGLGLGIFVSIILFSISTGLGMFMLLSNIVLFATILLK